MKQALLLIAYFFFTVSCSTIPNNESGNSLIEDYILPRSAINKQYVYKTTFINHKPLTIINKYFYKEDKLFLTTITDFGDISSEETNEMIVDNNNVRILNKERIGKNGNNLVYKVTNLSDDNKSFHVITTYYSGDIIQSESKGKLIKESFDNADLFGETIPSYTRTFQVEIIRKYKDKTSVKDNEIVTYCYGKNIGLIKSIIYINDKLNSTKELVNLEK